MSAVLTGSRLHFGLLSLPSADGRPTAWPDLQGDLTLPARHFGGVGLMAGCAKSLAQTGGHVESLSLLGDEQFLRGGAHLG
jgi:hypothetical protein